MHVVAIVLTLLAALLHGYIFVLESLRFDRPATWKIFGVRGAQEAAIARPWAFNQGFYNLFLAVIALVGVLMVVVGGDFTAGGALIFAGLGAMLGAAVVLMLSARDKARAAVTQGILPLIALVLLGAAAL